ncbi:MAG: serine hydrolase [Granulosicoccaceae bacterium]
MRSKNPVKAALKRFFESPLQESQFSRPLLQVANLTALRHLRDGYLNEHGPLRSIQRQDGFYLLHFDDTTVPSAASLDNQGRFNLLWFNLTESPHTSTLDTINAMIEEFGGDLSIRLERDGEVLFERDSERKLPVGSTFKLAVLLILVNHIEAGLAQWTDSMTLKERHLSLPSGTLQDETLGSRWTLEQLAQKMIADSDNTATDMLIDHLGRKTVELLSMGNLPFLTTAEFFKLKDPRNAELLQAWRNSFIPKRRAILKVLASRPLPPISLFDNGPIALDVEWFISTHEICGLLKGLYFHPSLTHNTGHLDKRDWSRIAYKGGSEPGVLNQSFLLQDPKGRLSCLSLTWRNELGVNRFPLFRLSSLLARYALEASPK